MQKTTRLNGLIVAGTLGTSPFALALQPNLVSITAQDDGTYSYVFTVKVDATERLSCAKSAPDPDFFTIFNFDGLVAGSATQPPGWSFASSTHGVTPIRSGRSVLAPVDTPGIPNLTWSCTGEPIAGPATIAGFSVRTRVKDTMVGEYGTQATRLDAATLHPKTPEEFKESRIGAITVPSLKVHQ